MRDLYQKKQNLKNKNRSKKPKKPRKPINYRRFLKRATQVVGALAAAGLCSGICYGAYQFLGRTTFLKIEKIEVSGSKRIKRDEVMALSGLRPGASMLRANLRTVAEHVKKNPWVEKVSVKRYFPHTVSVEISEWEPAAIVNMGYLYYLDGKGEIFKPLSRGDNLDYPVITGITEEDLAKDPAGCKAMLKAALDLSNQLKTGSVFRLEDISEIHMDKGYGLTIFTAQGGVPVKLGDGGYAEKLVRLSRIYKDLFAQLSSVEYIDLNYNDKIVVKKV